MPALLREALGCGEVFCVHRLDRETAGLMVYALNRKAAAALSAQLQEKVFQKEYLAVIPGDPGEQGQMRDLLFRDQGKNKSYVVKRMRKGVREARLSFVRIGQKQGLSLVRVALETGRSHQIRVQFASRGFPLVGDAKYGSSVKTGTLALWSAQLRFRHPESGEALVFDAPPPDRPPWNLFATG